MSSGSCQCLMTILSIVLATCFGSAVGITSGIGFTGLTSRAASLVGTSSLSAFSFRNTVPIVTFSDERAILLVRVVSRLTSDFGSGIARRTSAPVEGDMRIFTTTVVATPIKHNSASQTILIACNACARSYGLAYPGPTLRDIFPKTITLKSRQHDEQVSQPDSEAQICFALSSILKGSLRTRVAAESPAAGSWRS